MGPKLIMKRNKVLLLIILALAVFLRVYGLNKMPPELFGDEVDVGYQAYSLLKTARDYRGNFLPFYSESFAEPRAPLLLYAAVPFVALFGLNEWGVRLTPAFFGVLSIFVLYLLVREIFNDNRLALSTAFLLTITPWHLSYSRAAFEVTLLLFLILLATLSFFRALKGKAKFWPMAALSFGLSFYAYNTANVFVPLWGLFLLVAYKKEVNEIWRKSSKIILFSSVIFLLVISPLLKEVFLGSAGFRFKLVSIFSDPKMIDFISFKRSFETFGSLTEKLAHNKAIIVPKTFLGNYFEALSFKFLYITGDANPRHSFPGTGLLFLSFLPIFLLGFYQIFVKKSKEFWLLFGWLLIAPIPSSLTVDGGSHATRLFLMLPPLTIFSAFGLTTLFKRRILNLFLGILAILLLVEVFLYTHEILVHYTKEHFRYWHYGYREVLQDYKNNSKICQKFYLNNSHEPFLIRYLFWTKVDPIWFLQNFKGDQDNLTIKEVFKGFALGNASFGKNAYFGKVVKGDKLDAIKRLLEGKDACYIAFQGDEIPGDWDISKEKIEGVQVLGKVSDPWGKPYIYLLH